ncbi:3'(2'),5'-bisphosphate nucleotidase CysQ [Alkalihalobacterium alkalinitrilicum]|uniref:3'(2'),5'-bisphosphate nucleotidase CysQ n=1 Tax=Alkalihalobacterium alkalinitrilicum TaxID=427920 RepID=UPI0009954D7D|nr:3'(2'),5'-bisphosphate nucleotidase CysQ [Alkalihalobacterium alkalinitrilicum]
MVGNIKLHEIINIAIKAGNRILEIYQTVDFEVQTKQDDSPLTIADKKSNEVITKELTTLYPEIPILSEEGIHLSYEERKMWEYLWLVDPLDGTKEFIKKNGEFTVNIALIEKEKPVLGVIYAPVLDTVYFSKEGVGSFKLEKVSEYLKTGRDLIELANRLPLNVEKENTKVIASRSHMSKETKEYVNVLKKKVGEVDIISIGSSLKLCKVAEGEADIYPRFAPTMEWDTAAGQAIVEHSGGKVIHTDSEESLRYNKENLFNPWFIAKMNA